MTRMKSVIGKTTTTATADSWPRLVPLSVMKVEICTGNVCDV